MAQTLSTQRESKSNTHCWIIVGGFLGLFVFSIYALWLEEALQKHQTDRVWLGCVGFICQKVEKVLSTSVDKTQSFECCASTDVLYCWSSSIQNQKIVHYQCKE